MKRAKVRWSERGLPIGWLFAMLGLALGFGSWACQPKSTKGETLNVPTSALQRAKGLPDNASPKERLLASAVLQTTQTKGYNSAYVQIAYPNGDVPISTGVCSDVVVRAFRKSGIDLQKELHQDMSAHFEKYPKKWGLKRPDKNIDHRRVPNLMTWFDRKGKSLRVSLNEADYQPGDVVTWNLESGRTHIGIVSDIKVEGTDRYAIIHNIGRGARAEDVLFAWEVTGHYRYF